eukprot:scaffold71012_cov64-Phaeocystis_antarctica.AAC.3
MAVAPHGRARVRVEHAEARCSEDRLRQLVATLERRPVVLRLARQRELGRAKARQRRRVLRERAVVVAKGRVAEEMQRSRPALV